MSGYDREYTNVGTINGELQGSATALQMPDIRAALINFKARSDNAGNIYIGGASVTKPDGTTDVTTGIELAAGQETGLIPCTNLNNFHRICDNSGDDLTYIGVV